MRNSIVSYRDCLEYQAIWYIQSLEFDWEYLDKFSIRKDIVLMQILDHDYVLNHLKKHFSLLLFFLNQLNWK